MKQQLHYFAGIILLILMNANESTAQSAFDIYVFDVKAGITKRVTKIPNSGEYNVTWSNNGKKIAHDVFGPAAAPYDQSIFVTDIESGISIPLLGAEGGNDAAWAPGEEERNEKKENNKAKGIIAFDDWHTYPQSIFTVPAEGGTRSLLRYNAHHASWNPKGNKIAFDDNNGFIGTKDIKTGNETFVTYYGDRPSWSPNGQYIAFDGWSWAGGGVWIIKIDPQGNPLEAPVQLTTSGYGPTWKNNSKEIVFIDWPNGDPDLYSIPVTGGESRRVCGRVGGFDKGDYDPTYSNNGKYIAWSSYTDVPDYLHKPANQNPVTKFPAQTNSRFLQNYPNPFTDKTTIGFNILEPTHVVLSIYNLGGQEIQTLADADYQPGIYHLLWDGKTKDGQNLPNGIYLYQLKTSTGVQMKKMILMR